MSLETLASLSESIFEIFNPQNIDLIKGCLRETYGIYIINKINNKICLEYLRKQSTLLEN